MHLERSRGESNKFEPAICIDCTSVAAAVELARLVIYLDDFVAAIISDRVGRLNRNSCIFIVIDKESTIP